MSEDQIIAIIAHAIIAGILFFLLKHFLPTYFAEKGKNLATKQDIGEITKTVEDIKLNNNSQLEVMKLELELLSRNQQIIYDDERKAIIDFVNVITKFYELNIHLPLESNTQESVTSIQIQMRDLENDFYSINISHSTLKLFCFNENILSAVYPLLSQLSEIRTITQSFRIRILSSIQITKVLEDCYREVSNEENFNRFQQKLNEQGQIHEEFSALKENFYSNYVSTYLEFIKVCKEYLKTKKIKE
jgi:hypothetical protein